MRPLSAELVGPVMQMANQTLPEFAILTLAGLIMSASAALLVMDYRGFLTSYTHKCWLYYQRPWYRRLLLWTARSRAAHADEARLRRTFRATAILGMMMGLFFTATEVVALASGHVV